MRQIVEKMEFYGKPISEMSKLEKNLLVNDILLLTTCQGLKKGEVYESPIPLPFTLGTMESYLVLSTVRLSLVGQLLGIEDETDEMKVLVSEISVYSFQMLMENLTEMSKNGDFDIFKTFQMVPNFDLNFSMN